MAFNSFVVSSGFTISLWLEEIECKRSEVTVLLTSDTRTYQNRPQELWPSLEASGFLKDVILFSVECCCITVLSFESEGPVVTEMRCV